MHSEGPQPIPGPEPNPEPHGPSKLAVAGITTGSVLAVGIISLVVVKLMQSRANKKKAEPSEDNEKNNKPVVNQSEDAAQETLLEGKNEA